MIKGFRFTNQLSNAEVDARIHQEFLNKNDGVFYGMDLSHTTTSITVEEGLCEIAGRPVAVVDTETINIGNNVSYCLLILEIDLTKDSTQDVFEQVSFKILESNTTYPKVTQEDINIYNGENSIYQIEFARFKTNSSGITDFKDTRKFLSFSGIYAQIKSDCETVMEEIKQELANIEDKSAYVFKTEYKEDVNNINTSISNINTNISTINNNLNQKQKNINKGTSAPSGGSNGDIYIQYF